MKTHILFNRLLLLAALGAFLPGINAQHNARAWVQPTDTLVQKNLSDWQGLKFGLLMHWGTYSQWGIVESWSLCPEDEGWCERRGPASGDWYTYKQAYENLQTTFNPQRFNPEKWAVAAANAGMRYMVFTTKHHDGFCMFDTKQTNYKITDPKCPFSRDPRADVANGIFNAFRGKGMKVGAYFSKPDWHSPDFWWPYFPPKDRNINYDLNRYPERYKSFKEFTYKQLEELCSNYGKLDILWLDGGWVRPANTIDRSESWQKGIPDGQDVDMPRIAAMARERQPGIIVVDRWIPGPYENYLTPEQGIPSEPLGVPWETCMTMGTSWSYVFKEQYKSPRKIVHLLCDVVSKGGNLLLNIAPGPDGDWHPEAYERLRDVGAWVKRNGEAIYGTRTPQQGSFRQGNIVYTEKGNTLNALYLAEATETQMPEQICLNKVTVKPGSKIRLLGDEQAEIVWKQVGDDVILWPSAQTKMNNRCSYAWVFSFEMK